MNIGEGALGSEPHRRADGRSLALALRRPSSSDRLSPHAAVGNSLVALIMPLLFTRAAAVIFALVIPGSPPIGRVEIVLNVEGTGWKP